MAWDEEMIISLNMGLYLMSAYNKYEKVLQRSNNYTVFNWTVLKICV